jgi:flagellar basal-body rod protein FlgF
VDSGYYAAFSGLVARTQALDTAASNLSNTSTTGFRAERDYFRGAIFGPHALDAQLNRTVNDFGLLGGNTLDLGQGSINQTGNPLDVALEGEGFFAIQGANKQTRYTRNGNFRLSTDGRLITRDGETVLSSTGQPLQLPPGEMTIGRDGSITVAGGIVGNLGVFTFPKGTEMVPEGTNRFIAPPNAKPQQSQDAAVHQGSLEASNQDAIQGSLQLVLVQRQAEMMQKALYLFHTEFNRIASQDLAKV